MSSAYIDIDDVKIALNMSTTDTYLDIPIELAVNSACEAIDEDRGRSFGTGEDDEVRYFVPLSDSTLRLDDLYELTSVSVDRDGDGVYEDTLAVVTDFALGPVNAPVFGRPWTSLTLKRASQRFGSADAVEVTGRFGWPAIPQKVTQAALILAVRFLKRGREAPLGVLVGGGQLGSFEPISVSDPDVVFLLKGLSRRELLV